MGSIGGIIGAVFFLIVSFAAVTSSVSVMETIVSSLMDAAGFSRKKSAIIVSVYTLIGGIIVCLGYNKLYFELKLPNGSTGQILDLMDYISNSCLMPVIAFFTSILVGWVIKQEKIIDEITQGKYKFHRRRLYIIMIKYIVPVLLLILLLQAWGLF
jgi:NSS family neurotransmitter:Na+ symporter